MGLIGKLFGGAGDDKRGKKSGSAPRRAASGRQAKMPSGRKTPSVRKEPSSVKKPAAVPSGKAPAAAPAPETGVKRIAPPSGRKMRTSSPKKRLGQLLVKAGTVSDNQLDDALDRQKAQGGLLGQILIEMGFCSKADVGGAIKQQRTITTVLLGGIKFDPDALAALDTAFCKRNRLIPFEKIGNQLCVAMANVLDAQAKNDAKDQSQLQIKPFDASLQEIQDAIAEYLPGEELEAPKSAPAPEPAEDDIVIELPEEELDLVMPEEPSAPSPVAVFSPDETLNIAPGRLTAPEPEPEPEMVSIEELRKARESVRKPAPVPPAPVAEEPEEPVDLARVSPEETVAAAMVEPLETTGLPEIEELEEVVEEPSAQRSASDSAVIELEPDQIVEVDAEDLELADTVDLEPPAAPADILGEHLLALDFAAEDDNDADAVALAEPESEAAAADLMEASDLEEPEADEALQGIEEFLEEPTVEVESVAALADEPEETIRLAEVEIIAPVAAADLPTGELHAIPMSRGFFSEVVQWGNADAERRWLAEHLADNVLPMVPAPELEEIA